MYEYQKKEIKKMCEISRHLSKYCKIAFITSNKDKTHNTSDYSSFSVKSEFYSNDVHSKIVNAFKNIGFSVIEFFNEEDFIQYALKITKKQRECLIVINSAQKGTHIGRKSLIPAFCELYSIKYVGSNPYVVSLCRDKYKCGNILNQNGIPTPDAWLYNKNGWINGCPNDIPYKLILKPNYESSSIGVDNKCIDYYGQTFDQKVKEYSLLFNQDIIVEEFVAGYEVEIPIICTQDPLVFFPVGIEKNGEKCLGEQILDYKTRSENNYDFYDFSAYRPVLAQKLVDIAKKTVKLLDISGFGRIDFRIKENGDYFVTDISTNPHYTEQSSFFVPFKNLDMSYEDMINSLIASVDVR